MGSLRDDIDRGTSANEPSGGFSADTNLNSKRDKKLDQLEKEINDLDSWAGGIDPNEFVTTPLRYPHRDGADLGDNYVGTFSDNHGDYPSAVSDNIVPSSEAAMRQPPEFGPFFGRSKRQRKPMFARHRIKKRDLQKLKRNPGLLKYANDDFRFGQHSPLNNKLRQVLYGKADPYLKDKYMFPEDVIPSTKQYHDQVAPPVSDAVLGAKMDNHVDPWASSDFAERFRKPSDCENCKFKAVLEPKDKECEEPDCSETCVDDCEEGEDPIAEQLSKGAIDGHADPFGVAALLDDAVEPAEGVALDKALRTHFRVSGGEPIGDAALRGWDMQHGVDYEHEWDRDGKHDE